MLIHSKCGGQIYGKISLQGISPLGLTINGVSILSVSSLSIESGLKIFCSDECKEINPCDIAGKCSKCFGMFSASELYLSSNKSGFYCKNCREKDMVVSVEDSLKKGIV